MKCPMRSKMFVSSFILLLTCINYLHAQTRLPKEFETYVESVIEQFETPGISIAVVHNGSILFAKGYGRRGVGTNIKVDENTLFGIGSNTKAFTATAIGIIVEEGKLQLKCPEFQIAQLLIQHKYQILLVILFEHTNN